MKRANYSQTSRLESEGGMTETRRKLRKFPVGGRRSWNQKCSSRTSREYKGRSRLWTCSYAAWSPPIANALKQKNEYLMGDIMLFMGKAHPLWAAQDSKEGRYTESRNCATTIFFLIFDSSSERRWEQEILAWGIGNVLEEALIPSNLRK